MWLVGSKATARHTSCAFSTTSFASSKQACVSPAEKKNRRIDSGAGAWARGYSLESLSLRLRGAFMKMGGYDVVVVVVVVTTVVCVAGAIDSCPRAA